VNGRNAISWEDKFDLDVWYVDHWSLKLDVKIIVMTVLKVLKREGISLQGHARRRSFWGLMPQLKRGRQDFQPQLNKTHS